MFQSTLERRHGVWIIGLWDASSSGGVGETLEASKLAPPAFRDGCGKVVAKVAKEEKGAWCHDLPYQEEKR